MKDFIRTENEDERLQALTELNLLSGESEERFDRITRIAQRIFAASMADFSVIDATHQRFKSCYGMDEPSIERDISLANYALVNNGVFVVPDTMKDDRFTGNPLVVSGPKIRFFASHAVRLKSGHRIGALSVAVRQPRSFSAHDQSVLRDLAEMIENELSFMQASQFDRFTKLSINDVFFNTVQQGLRICERQKKPAVMIVFEVKNLVPTSTTVIDFDKDKHVQVFANLLRRLFRKSDVVGRIGSETFSALLINSNSDYVAEVVRRLQASVAAHNARTGARSNVSFDYSMVEFDPENPVSSNVLVEMASRGLHRLESVG